MIFHYTADLSEDYNVTFRHLEKFIHFWISHQMHLKTYSGMGAFIFIMSGNSYVHIYITLYYWSFVLSLRLGSIKLFSVPLEMVPFGYLRHQHQWRIAKVRLLLVSFVSFSRKGSLTLDLLWHGASFVCGLIRRTICNKALL